jgi:FHA domain
MIQSTALDIPQTYTLERKAPEDMDQATLELVKRMDQEVEAGRHPASITLIWKDASLKLDAASWRQFKDGKLDLATLGGRLAVQNGSDPLKPGGETTSLSGKDSGFNFQMTGWKAGLAGCGCLFFFLAAVLIVVMIIRKSRRKSARMAAEQAVPGANKRVPMPPQLPPPVPQAQRQVPVPPPLPSQSPSVPQPPPIPAPIAAPLPPPVVALPVLPETQALVILTGSKAGQTIELTGALRIGREADNDLMLDDPSISRHHALIQNQGSDFVLSDLASSNGTLHKGVRIQAPVLLASGDLVQFGQIQARIR